MSSRRLFSPILVLVALVVSGASMHGRGATQIQPPPGYPALGAPAAIKLISAGSAPLRALRYTVAPTFKGRMEMTTGMELGMTGLPIPMDMPAMSLLMALDINVTSVAPNGDIVYNLTFTKAEVGSGAEGPLGAALQGGLGGLVGLKGEATVSNRGVTKSVKMDLDKLGDPNLKQALSQMTSSIENLATPFPEEPVGVGARWESRQSITANGLTVFQRMEFEIESIDAGGVKIKVKTEQTAPPQSVVNPALPAEAEMKLENMTGSGTGTMTLRMDSLVPVAELNSMTTTAMSVNVAGQSMSMSVNTKIKVQISPGK